jgi:biotin carboxyl carrier protein
MNWRALLLAVILGTVVFGGLHAQTNTGNTPSNDSSLTTPNRLKINLTLGDPTELKVREGDTVNRGQVLSDKEAERSRLERDKRERLLAIANVEGQLVPLLQPAPALRELPPISYTVEETAIQLAEIKLAQAQRNLATAIEADPFISAKAKVERSLADVEAAHRAFELQQRKLDAVNGLRGLPPEMLTHETEKLRQARTTLEGKEAEYKFFQAEYFQVEADRRKELTDLQSKVAIARGELEQAQSRLRAAKENRELAEYNHRITISRRAEEENQVAINVANQKLDREFKLAQLREQLSAVEEKLNGIVQVKSPYSGTIKRIKFDRQTDGKLAVTLYLDTTGPSPTN